MSHVVIGTAGHIDHGKTALVKALTGVDTDRLEEEKKRGMTIDLGFAFINDQLSITDVPGHEKFIRNMVAGVSTIHMALIVIAADDGIMPQTLEHIQILRLLGVNQGVVALTKVDTVTDNDWIDLVEEEIIDLLNSTGFQDVPVIRTSIITGSGLDELKETLVEKAGLIGKLSDREFFRMPVDRVFSKSGFGTVVTGTVISGNIKIGNSLTIYPEIKQAKIRGLQRHGEPVSEVKMGDRAAINLAGLDPQFISRGSELSSPQALTMSKQWIVNVSILLDSKWELKNRQKIHIHVGTAETLATVSGLKKPLKPGESRNLILNIFTLVPAAMDDRMIIRSYSPVDTIGGGKILNICVNKKRKELIEQCRDLPESIEDRFQWMVNQNALKPKTMHEWSLLFSQPVSEIENFIVNKKMDISKEKKFIYFKENEQKHKDIVLTTIEDFNKNNPYHSSMNLEQLRKNTEFSSEWFDYLLSGLQKNGTLVRNDAGVSLAGHEIKLNENDKELIFKIEDYINKSFFEPVSRKSLLQDLNISDAKLNSFLHYLKNNNSIHEIDDNNWVSGKALESLINKLRTFFKTSEILDVSDFKDISSLTRKTAIPWLEFLDKKEYTQRDAVGRRAGKLIA